MKLIKLEIQNFRAFYGNHILEFAKEGHRLQKQNLLLYGENGSGKSSLLLAIQYALDSSRNTISFDKHKNIFQDPSCDRYIELTLRKKTNQPIMTCKWSPEITTTNILEIQDASQAKGILDYKKLLEVHFIHRANQSVNIFDLLLKSLLEKCINDQDPNQKTFSEQWQTLLESIPKRRNYSRQIDKFNGTAALFNQGLGAKLNQLKESVNQLMVYFGHLIEISFDFQGISFDHEVKYDPNNPEKSLSGKEILLNIEFLGRNISQPHHFLNEAKLTAIAISLYLSSLLVAPKPALKILVLDDIFIGLDMQNRLPMIDILKEKFAEYQIFLMTYDREWYEVLKQRLDGNKWLFQELYRSELKENNNVFAEVPVWKQDKDFLEKSEEYLEVHHEPRIAAVYLRMAFEVILKKYCDEQRKKVIYKEERKKLSSDDFWTVVKNNIPSSLVNDIETYRNIVMNPLSHSTIIQIHSQEVRSAIETVKQLKDRLF